MDSDEGLYLGLVFLAVVYGQVASTFSVFNSHDVAAIQEIVVVGWRVSVFVSLDCPFFIILTHIGFKPLKKVLRIASSKWGRRSEIRLKLVLSDRLFKQILRKVDVCIVLRVVKYDLIVENDRIAFLTILVSRLDLKSHATWHWLTCQLQFLTCFILFGAFLREL